MHGQIFLFSKEIINKTYLRIGSWWMLEFELDEDDDDNNKKIII